MSDKEYIIDLFLNKEITVATAESCTGGMVAATFTDFPGISSVFMEGIVTYANAAKVRLGVSEKTLEMHGAVSRETAGEMAEAVRKRAGTHIGISTTGIAGPGGGSDRKPVGLVYVGISTGSGTKTYALRLCGTRNRVRQKTVNAVFHFLRKVSEENGHGKN